MRDSSQDAGRQFVPKYAISLRRIMEEAYRESGKIGIGSYKN